MAKKKTINDEENGAIRKAIPAKAKAKVGKKISIKSASVQSDNEIADAEIKVVQDKENTDIVVDNKTQRQAPKTKKLPTNKKGYTPKVKVDKITDTVKDNSDSQIIPEASESMLPPTATNSAPKAVVPAVPNPKPTLHKTKRNIKPNIKSKKTDIINEKVESKLPAEQSIKLTAQNSTNSASNNPSSQKESEIQTDASSDIVKSKKSTKTNRIKLQLRKSNNPGTINPEAQSTELSIDKPILSGTAIRTEPIIEHNIVPNEIANVDTVIMDTKNEVSGNNETPNESPFDQALSNEALRRKQYWANRKKNKKLAIAAAAERRALALAKANEEAKKEEVPIDNINDTTTPINRPNPKPAANNKPITISAKNPIESTDSNNTNNENIELDTKVIGKNAAKNRKNKKNKKLRKLANTVQTEPKTEITTEENTIGKKANLLKFVITKDKIAKLDGVEIPAPKLPAKANDEKPEILHTRTNVHIAKNKIVLAKSPKRISDTTERRIQPIINIKQVIKAKSAFEIDQLSPNDIEKKKAIAALLSEIQKAPKSKLKVKIIFSEKKASLTLNPNQMEREDKYQKKKKKKKNQVNKYEAEALASKDEVIELPPEDYIKMTFPEISEHKHELEEIPVSRISSFTEINPNRKINNFTKVSPLIQEMINSVKQKLSEEFYSFTNARFLLAVSGGVDSIVMLDIMAQLADELKITISVAHFNHNLRGLSSDNDEELVKKICLSYGIKCYIGSENIIKYASDNAISIEQAARHRRYKMFERLSGNLKIDFVTTAHTADDSVETFLLNLLRGTGLTGLSGIPRKRHLVKNTYIIRPIIDFKKSDIYQYAKERNLQWREDESNTLTNYTRNKIRLELLPKIQQDFSPAIFDLINRTSRLIRGADEFINEFVENAVDTIIKDRRKDRFYISISQLETYSEFIQGEVIRACLSNVFKLLPPNIKVIDRVLALINSPSGAIADINKQIYALKDRGVIIFAQRTPIDSVNMLIDRNCEINLEFATLKLTPIDRKSVEFTKDPLVEYLDADLLPAKLQLRNWEQGDEFKPLGMDGTMKISDFLINQKIPSVEKRGVIVLSTKTDIIWVVGRRLSNTYKVTGNTQKVIKAELILKKEKGK